MVYDIFYVSKNIISEHNWKQFRLRFPSAQKIDNVKSFSDIKTKAFTKLFWIVWDDLEITENFDFSYRVLEWDQEYIHVWLNGTSYDGVGLFSKNSVLTQREFEYRFYTNKKEIPVIASTPRQYERFKINNYEDYLTALHTSRTDMFWGVWSNVSIINEKIFDTYFSHHNSYDKNENHVFKNTCNDIESFVNGVVLFSKNTTLSKKEIDYKFLINKKEYNILASRFRYPKYYIDTYEEYLEICKTEIQPLFWCIWPEIEITDTTIFDLYFDPNDGKYDYDRKVNHVFKNKDIEEDKYNGIMLLSTQAPISAREVEYRYLIEKKEYDVVVSELKLYDIVFISYNEPNADENFAKLVERFPRAKRVHGVKGIHQAHIAAAKLATTPMFWVVDGDAVVEDDFVFDLLLPKHDTDIVHVWLSRNPINNLTYGYGGVKLLPRNLTEKMDLGKSSVDMTMSISNKFKVMQTVSNITAFNTDPFNTWKSAFRECVKLASRPIDPKYQEETEDRLYAWCNFGKHNPLGKYAIMGATAGRQYGIDNIANADQLAKINDFDWLREQFQNSSSLT